MSFIHQPQRGHVRKLVELSAGQSIEGRITVVIPSVTCNFPDNATDCEVGGVGINLFNYKDKYPIMPLAFDFNKIKITAGTCLVGLE